jgi:hypothetical protein
MWTQRSLVQQHCGDWQLNVLKTELEPEFFFLHASVSHAPRAGHIHALEPDSAPLPYLAFNWMPMCLRVPLISSPNAPFCRQAYTVTRYSPNIIFCTNVNPNCTIAYPVMINPWEVIIVIFTSFPPSDNTDLYAIWTSHYSDNIPPKCSCNFMFSVVGDLQNICVKFDNCFKTQEPNAIWQQLLVYTNSN